MGFALLPRLALDFIAVLNYRSMPFRPLNSVVRFGKYEKGKVLGSRVLLLHAIVNKERQSMAPKHRSLLKYSNKVSALVVVLRESSRLPWTISLTRRRNNSIPPCRLLAETIGRRGCHSQRTKGEAAL